jgi:hypothetical protein
MVVVTTGGNYDFALPAIAVMMMVVMMGILGDPNFRSIASFIDSLQCGRSIRYWKRAGVLGGIGEATPRPDPAARRRPATFGWTIVVRAGLSIKASDSAQPSREILHALGDDFSPTYYGFRNNSF